MQVWSLKYWILTILTVKQGSKARSKVTTVRNQPAWPSQNASPYLSWRKFHLFLKFHWLWCTQFCDKDEFSEVLGDVRACYKTNIVSASDTKSGFDLNASTFPCGPPWRTPLALWLLVCRLPVSLTPLAFSSLQGYLGWRSDLIFCIILREWLTRYRLWGTVCSQTYAYFMHSFKDPRHIKFMVGTLR